MAIVDARASIVSLSLKDFRNFERLELELPSTGLVVTGENGHGKTNLLESAYYLSLLRSVRGARDPERLERLTGRQPATRDDRE